MHELTKNEELILLCIWKLEENTLYLLVRKKYVTSQESKPLSVKGGRRKILYSLTSAGEKALQEVQKIQKLAWGDVPDLALGKKK